MAGPLEGIRVLDMGAFGVGPQACGLLGLLGAEVIRIEPDYGDGLMRVNPLVNGMGTTYLTAHHNSKNIVMGLKNDGEKKFAYDLIKKCDVLIENRRVGALDRLGFGYDVLSKINPRLIYASSAAYGHTGPLLKYGGADHFIQAVSGFVSLNGEVDGLPQWVRYVALVDGTGSVVIMEACLAALVEREITGRGQYLDLDEFSSAVFMQATRVAEYFATGTEPRRMGSESPKVCPSKAYLTQDSKYVFVSALTAVQWINLCAALDLKDAAADERFTTNNARLEHREEVNSMIQEKLQDKPLVWWIWQFDRYHVPYSKFMNVEDLVEDPHIRANHLVVDLPSAWGPLKYADHVPWEFTETPINHTSAAPYMDADHDYVMSLIKQGAPSLSEAPRKATPPLQGIRVLDLTQGVAGPYCTAQLGSFGAEVIKVEKGAGDFARDWGPKIKNQSAIFLQLNHDKESVVIDYDKPEGRDILRDLAKSCDVFIEDLKPGEADNLGFGYESLKLLKKDIIYCSIYPFGDKAPYRDREATELELQAMSGMLRWVGELGKEPVRLGADAYSSLTGMFAFGGILAAVYNKKRKHGGERIMVSGLGTALYIIQHGILPLSGMDSWGGYWATGPYDKAETGFRTKNTPIMFGMMTKGEDQAKAAFIGFCKACGLGELLNDPYFVDKGFRTLGMGRDAQEMKPMYESAFENWDADELVAIIDKCGGLAAKMNTYKDLFDPMHGQIVANKMIIEQEHPLAGKVKLVNIPWRNADGPAEIKMPAPALGEHTVKVLSKLGYSEARIKKLQQMGITK